MPSVLVITLFEDPNSDFHDLRSSLCLGNPDRFDNALRIALEVQSPLVQRTAEDMSAF